MSIRTRTTQATTVPPELAAAAQAAVMSSRGGGHYVFWETPSAYGAYGMNLSFAAAEAAADKIRRGEIKP